MKKVLIFILLVLCLTPVFAISSFYKQLPAMFLVDLNAKYYVGHTSSTSAPRWQSGSASESTSSSIYCNNQIIAVLGVTLTADELANIDKIEYITFTVTAEGTPWVYLLDSTDTTISRPYGLDLICKGRNSTNTGETYANLNNVGPVVHMGLQDSTGLSGTVVTSTDISSSFDVPVDDLTTYGGIVWFDVCLVLPQLNDSGAVTINGKTYTAMSSDKAYTSKLKIDVKAKIDGKEFSDSYYVDMTGTYKSSSSSGTSDTGLKSMMNVVPTAAATSLNIQSLGESKSLTTVATYSYLTESKFIDYIDYEDSSAYIFLSSTSSQDTAGETFKLRRVINDAGDYSQTDNMFNSVTFKAYIKGGSNSKEFNGTTTYSSSALDNYFEVEPQPQVTSQNGEKYVRWFSDGEIQIMIDPTSSESLSDLAAGKYTETIYIHVVSPE